MSEEISRRSFLKKVGIGSAGSIAALGYLNNWTVFSKTVPEVKWNTPPLTERVLGDQWVPPEGYLEVQKAVDKPIEFINMGGMKFDPATAHLMERFEEITGIPVKQIPVPSPQILAKESTILSSRSPTPEVLQVDNQMYLGFVRPGWFEPVDELWNDELYEHYPAFLKENYETDIDATREGTHQYAAGFLFTEGHILHARTDLLEAAGFGPDKLVEGTWSDVRDVCEGLEGSGKFGWAWYGGGMRYPSYPFFEKVWSQGGSVLEDGKVVLNSTEALKAVEWYVDLIKDGLVPDIIGLDQGGPEDLFLAGKIAGFIGGAEMIADATAEIPDLYVPGYPSKADSGPNPQYATWAGADYICINPNADPVMKLAAKMLGDYWRSYEHQADEWFIERNPGGLPEIYDRATERQKSPFKEYIKYIKFIFENGKDEIWPQQIDCVVKLCQELQNAYALKKSPKQALDDVQKYTDSVLQQ